MSVGRVGTSASFIPRTAVFPLQTPVPSLIQNHRRIVATLTEVKQCQTAPFALSTSHVYAAQAPRCSSFSFLPNSDSVTLQPPLFDISRHSCQPAPEHRHNTIARPTPSLFQSRRRVCRFHHQRDYTLSQGPSHVFPIPPSSHRPSKQANLTLTGTIRSKCQSWPVK